MDNDPVCPSKKNLKGVDGITIWSEGVAGDFALKIYEISAVAKAVEGPLGEPIEPTLVRCPW